MSLPADLTVAKSPGLVGDTFDDRWARWQAKSVAQDRRWQRVALAAAVVLGMAGLARLAAVTLIGR